MPNLQLSQTTSSEPGDLWKVLTEFESWPKIYPHLQRVEVLKQTAQNIELELTDDLGRTWREVSVRVEQNRLLELHTQDGFHHPLKFSTQCWQIENIDGKTKLSLSREHGYRLPLVGALVEPLVAKSKWRRYCQQTVDGIVRKAHERVWSYQQNVQTILSHKGTEIISVLPSDTVDHVCKKIFEHRIGALLVIDNNGELVGLVSERDVVNRISQQGVGVLEKPVEQIMTRELIICQPESDLLFVLACMTDNKVRHLPVIKDGHLKGVISIGDVVQQRLKSLEVESDTLREYIAAREWHRHSINPLPAADVSVTNTLK